jgi:transcriptional regulator with XRE-family HTH domain
VDLGRHTGLSPALLSKLERGKMFPTLQTLLRIDLDYFFADHRKHRALAVVRRAARLRFPEAPGRRDPTFHFESLTFPVAEPRCQGVSGDVPPDHRGQSAPA